MLGFYDHPTPLIKNGKFEKLGMKLTALLKKIK